VPEQQPHPLGSFAALIFDCDGTLVESNELHYRAINEVARSQGLAMTREWFFAHVGCSQGEILRRFQEEFNIVFDPRETSRLFMSAYQQGLSALKEIPAVAAIARRHRGQVPLAVVSGGARAIVEPTLRAADLFELFDTIVTIEDAGGRGKPAPDLFLEAARRLNAPADKCMVFEDSAEGIEAARRAGMQTTDVRTLISAIVPASAMSRCSGSRPA